VRHDTRLILPQISSRHVMPLGCMQQPVLKYAGSPSLGNFALWV